MNRRAAKEMLERATSRASAEVSTNTALLASLSASLWPLPAAARF